MSAICARLTNKGKAGVQRGRKTAGCPSFLPTAVGTALSQPRVRQSPALRRAQLLAEFQRKTLRPLGTNTLAQFEYPAQPVLKKVPPVRANPLTQFEYPGFPVQEKGEDAKSNGETAANFVYCYKIARNRAVLLEMMGAKC
mgnify:CR=1 FL=1